MADIVPFKINIPSAELDLLTQKVRLSRLPSVPRFEWTEENGITQSFVADLVKFWQEEYSWRDEEARINAALPQYTTQVEVDDGFGVLDIHFVHRRATITERGRIPLLFVHGWPGSVLEIWKGLDKLNGAAFDVVAPSLPGYGFSSYPGKKGFDIRRHAEVLDKLMRKLGYESYVVQGGDWGSWITRTLGLMYPQRVRALHLNMFKMEKPDFPGGDEPQYTEFEKRSLDRFHKWFLQTNGDYGAIQATRPQTLGYAMHDSPVGLLVWFTDKLRLWSDDYPWTPTELITWTLMHYWPGPTAPFVMYAENSPPAPYRRGTWADRFLQVPCGFSAFPKELGIMPRSWVERVANVKFWREHPQGGHFAMWERPDELVADMTEFYRHVWEEGREVGECT